MFDVNETTMLSNLSELLSDPSSSWYLSYWSPCMRYALITYLLLIMSFGLVGNLIALFGSIFHDAIKTDHISVILLRNLALTDILISIFLYIPALSTLIAERWVLSADACAATHYLFEVLLLNKLIVIAIISIYRLWMLKKPPAVKKALPQRPWIIACAVIPLVAFFPFFLMELIMPKAQTFFDPHRFMCYGWNYYHSNALYSLLFLFPVLVVPIVVILAANIRLIYILVQQARKTRRAFHQRRLFICIKIVRLIIVVTYLPSIIFMIAQAALRPKQGDAAAPELFTVLSLIYFILPLNCAASPIIYMLANSSFRDYLAGCFGLGCWNRSHIIEYKEEEEEEDEEEGETVELK